jgi:hypothetical protein
MIDSRYSINIINWLNYNSNLELEDKLLNILAPLAIDNYEFYLDLNNYLRKDLFNKMGFTYSFVPDKDRPDTDPDNQVVISVPIYMFCFITNYFCSF